MGAARVPLGSVVGPPSKQPAMKRALRPLQNRLGLHLQRKYGFPSRIFRLALWPSNRDYKLVCLSLRGQSLESLEYERTMPLPKPNPLRFVHAHITAGHPLTLYPRERTGYPSGPSHVAEVLVILRRRRCNLHQNRLTARD